MADRLGAIAAGGPGPTLGLRWWRLAGGACLGAACATKWSGMYFLLAFGLLALIWDASARRAAGVRHPWRAALRRDLLQLAVMLGAIPILVYLASWTGWFVTDEGWDRQWANPRDTAWPIIPDALRSLWHYHAEMYNFHAGLSSRHPYESRALGWLVLARPVLYYYKSPPGCGAPACSSVIIAIGTPALWFPFLLALIGTASLWVSRRDWRAGAVLVAVAAGLVPWIALPERTMFLFYAVPALPFLVLATTLCLGWILGGPSDGELRRQIGAVVVGGYVILVAVNFFYLLPILSAENITYAAYRARIWLGSWV